MSKAKHTPIINFNRATCSCGNMPGIWRGNDEPIGKFTLRADAAHRDHAATAPPIPAGDLFDFRKTPEPATSDQGGLFA